MKTYYATKISENMSTTDEGFLICRNVPISRTGYQEYNGEELDLDHLHGKAVKVYRSPEEVFAPEAMASFEGKPVCNEHPSGGVNADNAGILLKGIMRDIRRGEQKTENGEELLLADFIIYDSQLITAIQNGKRDVSCGYLCEYVINEQGIVEQKKIRGNHGAVVTTGRAGPEVAIQDSKPTKPIHERRHRLMKKSTTPGGILARLSAMIFSTDAAPEEKAEILEEVGVALLEAATEEGAAAPAAPAAPADNAPPAAQDNNPPPTNDNQAVMDAIAGIADQVAKLSDTVAAMQGSKDEDPLEKLEAELAGTDSGSAQDTDPTGDNDGAADNQPDTQTADEDPDEGQEPVGVVVNDRNAMLQQIRAIKPAIAAIKDPKARRLVSDSMAKAFRAAGAAPSKLQKPVADGYAGIMQIQQAAAKKLTRDSQPPDQSEIGRSIRDNRNPHYRGNK